MNTSIRSRIDDASMSRFQWSVIAVCVMLNVIDGFDVLVIAFTGHLISEDWGLSGAQLGLLLSAGLVGMAIGSLVIGPLADRSGRRPVVLGCLAVAGVAMTLSSAAQSAEQLALLRVITGLGIGGILATGNVIAAEYSSARWRGLGVSLNSTGYSIGATAGGLLSALLSEYYGWRGVFLVGGILTLALIPVVWWRLPESIDYLLNRRPSDALPRVNSVLVRMGHDMLDALPAPLPSHSKPGGRYRRLLHRSTRRTTLLLWVLFFCVMAGFYFVTSWTPTLLVEAGLSPDAGITGGTLLNLGGIFGTATLGLLAARFPMKGVLGCYLLATALLMGSFIASTSASLVLAFGVAVAIGLFANGCVAGLYTLTPIAYGPEVRATGVGTALAIGRAGAILAPTLAGAMLDAGAAAQTLYFVFGAVFLAAIGLVLPLRSAPAGAGESLSGPPVSRPRTSDADTA